MNNSNDREATIAIEHQKVLENSQKILFEAFNKSPLLKLVETLIGSSVIAQEALDAESKDIFGWVFFTRGNDPMYSNMIAMDNNEGEKLIKHLLYEKFFNNNPNHLPENEWIDEQISTLCLKITQLNHIFDVNQENVDSSNLSNDDTKLADLIRKLELLESELHASDFDDSRKLSLQEEIAKIQNEIDGIGFNSNSQQHELRDVDRIQQIQASSNAGKFEVADAPDDEAKNLPEVRGSKRNQLDTIENLDKQVLDYAISAFLQDYIVEQQKPNLKTFVFELQTNSIYYIQYLSKTTFTQSDTDKIKAWDIQIKDRILTFESGEILNQMKLVVADIIKTQDLRLNNITNNITNNIDVDLDGQMRDSTEIVKKRQDWFKDVKKEIDCQQKGLFELQKVIDEEKQDLIKEKQDLIKRGNLVQEYQKLKLEIVKFYQDRKNFSPESIQQELCKTNPRFWLQKVKSDLSTLNNFKDKCSEISLDSFDVEIGGVIEILTQIKH